MQSFFYKLYLKYLIWRYGVDSVVQGFVESGFEQVNKEKQGDKVVTTFRKGDATLTVTNKD